MATIGAWGFVIALAIVTIVAAYALFAVCGAIGQRVATRTGRGWVGAAIGITVLLAAIGGEAWLARDHISCGPNGCHEDGASPPEYP